ncbi:MAG TPA: DUF3078 domain-containing protein [Saprospiraceae bacterium]|nr:DUF3078 domain-containing protein [Saprospiraceae bacterium]
MKLLLTPLFILFACVFMNAQTQEELLATKAAKEAELAILQPELKDLTGRVDALNAEIAVLKEQTTPYPRWDIGSLGNVGFSFSSFSDWLSKSSPNTTAFTMGFTGTGYVNLDQRKYFWRNNANLTLGWQKFNDRDDPTDSKDFKVAADALSGSSLFGYKLSDKWALSALGDYRTSILDDKFNNPGFLDLGVGATWTPVKDLVVVIHPLDYNFVFSSGAFDYKSSFGAKVLADYTRKITKAIAWRSNATGFFSYEGSDLSNWTWVNSFSTATKHIGIGLDIGLRGNKQEALAAGRTDNPLQSYWIVGLAYKL